MGNKELTLLLSCEHLFSVDVINIEKFWCSLLCYFNQSGSVHIQHKYFFGEATPHFRKTLQRHIYHKRFTTSVLIPCKFLFLSNFFFWHAYWRSHNIFPRQPATSIAEIIKIDLGFILCIKSRFKLPRRSI